MTALPLALLAFAPATLKWSPKVDTRSIYGLKAIIDLGGQDDVRFSGNLSRRIKSVEGSTVTSSVETRIDVDVMGVARMGRPILSDRIERIDGSLVQAEKVEPTLLFAVPRIDRLRSFYYPATPVEVGTGWWHVEDDGESPPFASYLRLEGDEKIGAREVWRVSSDANESHDEAPVHVKGMVWLDKTDGSLIRGQWSLEGFVLNAATPSMKAKIELSRIDEASAPSAPGSASPGAGGSSSGNAPRRSPSRR